MKRVLKQLREQLGNERGQGMTEYAIIVILIAIVVLAAVQFLGGMVGNKTQNAAQVVSNMDANALQGTYGLGAGNP